LKVEQKVYLKVEPKVVGMVDWMVDWMESLTVERLEINSVEMKVDSSDE
jgi:hypothetical protein